MERVVENPELKPQIEAFVIEALENCDLFVKTYGRGYAAERLSQNFKHLYTDDLNKKARGQYTLGTAGIMTLFIKGKNGNLLRFEDIQEKEDLQTVLHESVHAIFNRIPKECKQMRLRYGSGIHEVYDNTELGRGLNEGYTNWVCTKAGYPTTSYPTLTNLLEILEKAIGSEKVMEFGKGNISKNLPKLLGMNVSDCLTLLAKADTIYDYQDKSHDFSNLAYVIRRKTFFETDKIRNPDIIMDEELSQELQGLYNNKIYKNLLSNSDYIKYTEENNLKPELEGSKLSYFEHQNDFYLKKAKEIDEEIKGDIFSKYFMQELKQTIEAGDFSTEKYMRFAQLSALIYQYGDFKNETLQNFKEEYEILRKHFFDKAENEIRDELNKGTLDIKKIVQYRDVIVNGNQFDPGDFNTMLSKIMLPENSYAYEDLFRTLSSQNMTSELFNYRIFELNSPSGQQTKLFFNTNNNHHFTRFISKPKVLSADSQIKDKDSLFDVTLTELQSMQEIVKNFLVLKEEICQKNPKTKLQIVDNLVLSMADGEEPTFYMIDGNNWVQATAREFIPQNVQTSRETSLNLDSINVSAIPEKNAYQENTYLEPISKNPFKRFFQEIKRRFFSNEPALAIADTQQSKTSNKMEEDKKRFEKTIRFTEDNKPIQTPTIDQESIKEAKQTSENDKNFTK